MGRAVLSLPPLLTRPDLTNFRANYSRVEKLYMGVLRQGVAFVAQSVGFGYVRGYLTFVIIYALW